MITTQQLVDACRLEAKYTEGLEILPEGLWKEGMLLIGLKFRAVADRLEGLQNCSRQRHYFKDGACVYCGLGETK